MTLIDLSSNGDDAPTPATVVNGCTVRVGTAAWSERSLTHESDWYPRRSMRAAERIAYYGQRFSVTEIETTYRFPPTPDVAKQWAERTPQGFVIDVQAWSLLTGQATIPGSLWEDLHAEVSPQKRDLPRLYAAHLSDDAVGECWRRFHHALLPLVQSGRLGSVVLRYPRWFGPRDPHRQILAEARHHLAELPVMVELAHPDWVAPEECENTFDLLDGLGLGFVCIDAAQDNPRGLAGAAATTCDTAMLRLLGRRDSPDDETERWAPDRRGYRYTDQELDDLVAKVQQLVNGARELHVIVSTCWRDDAVKNAERLFSRLCTIGQPV